MTGVGDAYVFGNRIALFQVWVVLLACCIVCTLLSCSVIAVDVLHNVYVPDVRELAAIVFRRLADILLGVALSCTLRG